MESQRLSLMLAALLLSVSGGVRLAADEPAMFSPDAPPLLLETGDPVAAEKPFLSGENEPVDRSPIEVEDPSPTVEGAFNFKRGAGTEPPLLQPKPSASDIGELLSSVGEANGRGETPLPVAATAFQTQLAQLERAASEASNLHSLSRLATAAEALATRSALSEANCSQAKKLASWAYAMRGRYFASDGNRQAAMQDFDRAVRLVPESTTARLDRAISLAEQGEADRALKDFDRVLALAPEWSVARRNRAALLFGMGEDQRALDDCNVALRLLSKKEQNTGFSEVLILRGRILHRLGHNTEAIADFDEAIRQQGVPKLYHLRGNVFAEVGFYEQAIKDYLTAVHADPAMAEAYRSLAWVLATCPEKRLRNPATAIEAAGRARRLGTPGDPMMLDASAAAHASAGNYDEAIRLQQRALVAASSSSASRFRERLQLYRSGHSYTSPVVSTLESPGDHSIVVPVTHESTSRPGAVRHPAMAR